MWGQRVCELMPGSPKAKQHLDSSLTVAENKLPHNPLVPGSNPGGGGGRARQPIFDILPAASGEDSYGAGCWSGLFGGFLHNRLSSTEDNKEASLLGCPPIGLVDEEKFMVRNQEGLISPGLKHRGFTAHAGEF